ncbi:MAG: hypothetical protein DHS20C20_14710 [Ardenticatenaceae bacterium]|nr:MAG: hypothetical protein DHS20C20_14710 [Ardenticatenaceae bacterium]
MNPALNSIAQTLKTDLGSQLEAVFLFGSQTAKQKATAVSDSNLLLITKPETNIQTIRNSFYPLWQTNKMMLKRAPLIANRRALSRHLQLNPQLALNLLQHGQQLAGDPVSIDIFRTPANPYEIYADLSLKLLDASNALVPNSEPESELTLNRLFRQITNKSAEATDTAVSQFNTVQQAVTAVLNKLPAAKIWHTAAQSGPTSPNIPGLQAIYTENKRNIFVFNQLTPQQIRQINWQTVAQHLPRPDDALHITTVAQFCLMALYDKALDLRFNKYSHKWGIHFLDKLKPSNYQILRQAARIPSHILVDALPHSMLTATNANDETLHKLIHDYQNRMLNIQLENELLFRLGLIPAKFVPPEPLPEPDVPASERLDAIFQHLDWWTDFYQTALQSQT